MAAKKSAQRTAHIPIPSRMNQFGSTSQQRDGNRLFDLGPPSFTNNAAAVSCQSCHISGAKCIAMDDGSSCTACVGAGSECSFMTLSPQSRKRKLDSNVNAEANFKKG
jgi:hypothetical protein